MALIRITTLDDPRLAAYTRLTELVSSTRK